jgi:hypothetical protein
MIPEKIFYDKELSDALRDLVINSPVEIKEAINLLELSNDYKRDSFIIKKLKISGCFGVEKIRSIISVINSEL